jgi:hypothetical protein
LGAFVTISREQMDHFPGGKASCSRERGIITF